MIDGFVGLSRVDVDNGKGGAIDHLPFAGAIETAELVNERRLARSEIPLEGDDGVVGKSCVHLLGYAWKVGERL